MLLADFLKANSKLHKKEKALLLFQLIAEGKVTSHTGLCRTLEIVAWENEINPLLIDLAPLNLLWPKHSKDYSYPVPGLKVSPKTAYYDAFRARRLYTGEYGALRRELAGFLVDKIDKLLDENLQLR